MFFFTSVFTSVISNLRREGTPRIGMRCWPRARCSSGSTGGRRSGGCWRTTWDTRAASSRPTGEREGERGPQPDAPHGAEGFPHLLRHAVCLSAHRTGGELGGLPVFFNVFAFLPGTTLLLLLDLPPPGGGGKYQNFTGTVSLIWPCWLLWKRASLTHSCISTGRLFLQLLGISKFCKVQSVLLDMPLTCDLTSKVCY